MLQVHAHLLHQLVMICSVSHPVLEPVTTCVAACHVMCCSLSSKACHTLCRICGGLSHHVVQPCVATCHVLCAAAGKAAAGDRTAQRPA